MKNTLYYGDHFKWFVGIVKDVAPDRARVKVRIYGIHRMDDIQRLSNEDLPWALVVYPVTGNQMGSGNLSHDLRPETWVLGFFADGDDCRFPIVTGVFGPGQNAGSYFNGTSPGTASRGAIPGSVGSTLDPDSVAPSNLPGNTRAEQAYNFFRTKLESVSIPGDPHTIASTIVGFLQVESFDRLDHTVVNSVGAYGIAQWLTNARRENLFIRSGIPYPGRAAFRGIRSYTNGPTFEQQLQFVWEEFKMPDGMGSWDILIKARESDFITAGRGMMVYERNEAYQGKGSGQGDGFLINESHPNFRRGIANAKNIYNLYKDSYTGVVAPTPSTRVTPGFGFDR